MARGLWRSLEELPMQLTILGDFVDDLSRSREPGGVRGETRRPGLARPRGRLCSEATPNPRSGAGLSPASALARAMSVGEKYSEYTPWGFNGGYYYVRLGYKWGN